MNTNANSVKNCNGHCGGCGVDNVNGSCGSDSVVGASDSVAALRAAGYCVVIWTPEEIGESNVRRLEDIVIQAGNEYLGS